MRLVARRRPIAGPARPGIRARNWRGAPSRTPPGRPHAWDTVRHASQPCFPHPAGDVDPPGADVRMLAKARQTISSLAHPHTRPIVEAAMGTLHAAPVRGRSSGLQDTRAADSHPQACEAGVDGRHHRAARPSRHPAAREVLDAMPKDFAMKAHAEVLAAVERISRGVPEDAVATREHVARAIGYLEALPVVLRALVDIEGVASGRGRVAPRSDRTCRPLGCHRAGAASDTGGVVAAPGLIGR